MSETQSTLISPTTSVKTGSSTNKTIQGDPQAQSGTNPDLGDIMPIASYEGENNQIYASEYYGLDTPYEFLDSAIREDLESIDGFVKQFIKDENKEDTIASYNKTLKALEKKLGIDESMLRTATIQKIATVVKNYAKVAEAYTKNIRRKVLNKLIKLSKDGKSDFDQTQYLLEQMGGLV